jgi:hypothetical protein
MKKILMLLAVLGLAASVGAQSVADLAKREKKRRESLKGQHAVVVKNEDLMRVKKVAAVQVSNPDAAVPEAQDVEPATVPSDADGAISPSSPGAASGRNIVPRVAANGPLITGDANRDQAETGGTLDAQLKSANDLVDLLTTKMNALRQQFEFQDNMVPGYVIQQQIDETGQRLIKAQAQQARLQAEMEKKGLAKKDPGTADR